MTWRRVGWPRGQPHSRATCCTCGQPVRETRAGIRLSPLKAALFDAIASPYGASIDELMTLDAWHDRRRPKRVTVRMHVLQLRELLLDTGYGITTGLDHRY